MTGMIYLLHFDEKLNGQQHYLGWTGRDDLRLRIKEHRLGQGGKTTRRFKLAGIPFTLARAWEGTRDDEKRFKNKSLASLCSLCKENTSEEKTVKTVLEALRELMDDDGYAEASVRGLAAATGLSKRKAGQEIAALTSAGKISMASRGTNAQAALYLVIDDETLDRTPSAGHPVSSQAYIANSRSQNKAHTSASVPQDTTFPPKSQLPTRFSVPIKLTASPSPISSPKYRASAIASPPTSSSSSIRSTSSRRSSKTSTMRASRSRGKSPTLPVATRRNAHGPSPNPGTLHVMHVADALHVLLWEYDIPSDWPKAHPDRETNTRQLWRGIHYGRHTSIPSEWAAPHLNNVPIDDAYYHFLFYVRKHLPQAVEVAHIASPTRYITHHAQGDILAYCKICASPSARMQYCSTAPEHGGLAA
jgi:predicted GIY-YIG superfamily endonuclease